MADRWQLLKDGVPIMVCNSIEEAEKEYRKYDCDEMRRIPSEICEDNEMRRIPESEDNCQT